MSLIKKFATAGAAIALGLGVGAVGASSASAGILLDYTVPNGEFVGHSENSQVFGTDIFSVTCDTAEFSGDADDATTSTIPFHAEYSDCVVDIAGLPLHATVTTNSDWELNYVSGDASSSVTATVDLLPASSGSAVTIHVPDFACTIEIDDQSGLEHVVATNEFSPTGVTIDATVDDIVFTSDCPLIQPGGLATYDGRVTIPGITMINAAT